MLDITITQSRTSSPQPHAVSTIRLWDQIHKLPMKHSRSIMILFVIPYKIVKSPYVVSPMRLWDQILKLLH